MPFEEKVTWINAVVTAIVPVVYFVVVLGQLGQVSASEIAYQQPMLITIGVTIVLTIFGAIAMGIGSSISAEITKPGSSKDVGRKDERDVTISRRGDLFGYYVSSAGMVGVMALIMLEYEYFWIANALYLSFVIGTLVAATVKLVAYRRGF